MRAPHRRGHPVHRVWCVLVPFAWALIPALAQAQSSPGNIATTPLPAMADTGTAAAPAGGGRAAAGGGQSLAPTLFDQFSVYGDLSERYTDNALGSATHAQSDFDTRAQLGVNASKNTLHLQGALSYSGSVDYFARNSQNLIVSNYLNAQGIAELIPDHFLLQGAAFATPVYVSRLGNIAPSGEVLPSGADSDMRNYYGFLVQPDFTFRLGDFLRSDLLPSYSAEYFDQPVGAGAVPGGVPVAGNYATKAVTERISSGDYFSRLQWGLIGSYSEMGQSAAGLTQRSATGELAYAIDHGISVVADGGYQTLQSRVPFRNPLSGPIILGGLRFDLAKLTGEFRLGEQYHSFSVVGHLNYQITPRIGLSADAQDGVNAPGANLMNPQALLSGLIQGIASGQIQIPSSGISLGSLINTVGLQNSIARFKTDTLSLNYTFEDTTLTLTGFNTEQDTQSALPEGNNGDLRSTGLYAGVSQGFTQDLRGSFDVAYHDDSLTVGRASNLEFDATADYSLTDTTQLYAQADYYMRLSNQTLAGFSAESGDVSVASIRLGIRHSF